MKDNIQKLYEIAGVDYEERYNNCTLNKEGECRFKSSCDICNYSEERYVYPTFTAEKQLELIKCLMQYKQTLLIELQCFEGDCCITHCTECEDNDAVEYVRTGRAKLLENAIADLFIDMWQDLTEEQKQEVKRMLQ